MVPRPTEFDEIGPLYARFMEEIKLRVDAIKLVFDGTSAMARMPAFEFCYLQLRKICELFALACLTAHGDIPGVRTKSLQTEWNADQIIKQLSDLHPRFYPVPSEQRLDPKTQKPIQVVPLQSGFLTKDELLRLYGECGNFLHRGSIRQLLGNWEPKPNFEKITEWIEKFVKLLNHHQIQTSQPDKQLWVLMHGRDDGRVHWHVMQRIQAP